MGAACSIFRRTFDGRRPRDSDELVVFCTLTDFLWSVDFATVVGRALAGRAFTVVARRGSATLSAGAFDFWEVDFAVVGNVRVMMADYIQGLEKSMIVTPCPP